MTLNEHQRRDRFAAPHASTRLQAALSAGTDPHPSDPPILIERCGVEPEFFVRDMLTWAITRHPASTTVDLLLAELNSEVPRARSQALHSLSKIGDARAWPAITTNLLTDPDDAVAQAAWRTAAALVPEGSEASLAAILVTQLGRGGRDVQRSLTRAFAMLGEPAKAALVTTMSNTATDPAVRAHALATDRFIENPDEDVDAVIDEANRVLSLRGAPLIDGSDLHADR